MTDKDPKDMTVSEQLRWAANGEPYNGIDENIWTYPTGKIRALAEAVTGEWPSDNEIFSIVADKIDAELAEARELSLRRGAELWAKANGWPDFRDGEDFGAWLERCALPRPRFEDGEPVQFGELVGSNLVGAVKVSAIEFTEDGTYVKDEPDGDWSTSLEVTTNRLKRPAPDVLGADGLPIKAGETVWGILSGSKGIVNFLNNDSTAYVEWDDGRWSPSIYCCNLTRTPPETQERIDDDATMPPAEYCAVRGIDLGDDPDRATATVAMVRDLLRRQRELDKRTGGDA